jgi:hypothetical protein
MVGLCQSQRHHSCLIIVRISSSGESGKGKNVLTDTEGVLSRFPFTGAQGRISRVPEKSAWAAYWFDEGRTRGVYHFRGSGISLLVCAEHLQHTHSGICTCISRTDYSKPPKGVPL